MGLGQAGLPLGNVGFHPFDDLRKLRGQILGFPWVFLDFVEPCGGFVPGMDILVFGGVFALEPKDQLPVRLDTPEVLQGVVRVSRGHVVDSVGDPENLFPCRTGLGIHQVDSRKAGSGLKTSSSEDGREEVDRMSKVTGTLGFQLAGPGDHDRRTDPIFIGRTFGA